MGYMSAPYRNACTIANHLMELILLPSEDTRNTALLAREWLNIEQAKREWRGLPRLAPASMRELLDAKRAKLKTIHAASFTEPEPDHPISQTVPTPPPQSPP